MRPRTAWAGEKIAASGIGNPTKFLSDVRAPEGVELPYIHHVEVIDTGDTDDPRLVIVYELPDEI